MSKIEKGREYEIYINDYLKTLPETENSYLWDEVPEKILYEAGLINLYNIKKLSKKQSKTNPLKDVGIDIIMVNKTGEIEFVQCKYYDGSSLTLDKLSGFWFMMAKHKTTKGSIYHTSPKVSHWLKQIPDRITLKYKQIENKTPSDASSPNDNTLPHTGKGPQNESHIEKSNDNPNVKPSKETLYENIMKAPDVKEIATYQGYGKMESKEKMYILLRYNFLKKYKLTPDELTLKKLEELYDKDKILENALYALKIDECINNNKKGKMDKKLPYMTKIMEIFGFKDIMDRESKIKCTEEILKKMESTGYLEHGKHDEILRLFNKQIKSKTKTPANNDKNKGCAEICDKPICQKNYTKIFNVILSNYGIKLENTRKSIMKKGITRWEYVYYLSENITGITNIINRYQTS